MKHPVNADIVPKLLILMEALQPFPVAQHPTLRFQTVREERSIFFTPILLNIELQSRIFRCWFSCLLFAAAFPIAAQERPQLLFDNYSTDGLSNNVVHATLRDRQGFLWLATDNGLNRFDGYSYKTFLHISGDSTSIGDNTCYALAEDSKGFLWVGTANGLYRYNPLTERFTGSFLPRTIDSSGFDVKQVFMDAEDCLWMGSSLPVGLFRYDTRSRRFDHFVNRAAQKFGAGNVVNDIWKDKNGLIWLGTFNGLFTFQPATGEFENMLQAPAEKDKFRDFIITSVLQDAYRERLLWLTIWGDGLWKYDKITRKSERFLPEPQYRYDAIHNVLQDAVQPDSNHFWLAAGELLSFDVASKKFNKLSSQHPALPLKVSLQRFHTDKAGNCWIAGSGGIARISGLRQQFGINIIPKSLTIRAIFDDPIAGKTYFGSIYHNRSLLILDKKTGQWETIHLPLLDKILAGPVKFLKDSKGFLWFLTNKGLFRFDLATHRFEEKQVVVGKGEKLGQRLCQRGEEDAEGNLWFLFDNHYLVKYTLDDDIFTLKHQQVSTLGKGQNGKLLIVKHDGILLLHPQASKVFYPFSLPGKAVSCIAEDKRGNLWVGTSTDGIFSWNPGEDKPSRVRTLRMETGLPSNWIHQITCDPDGFVWANTRQGLVKINPDDRSMNLFTKEDGLLTDDFDTELIFQPSGEVFLPLYTSLYHHFDFRKIHQPDLDSLPFHFHTFRIGGKPVVFEKNINHLPVLSLHYPDNAFSVEFAALNFDGQKSIRYAFRLAGPEAEWTDAYAHRYAAFSHLPPGEYCLEVRMSNRQGFWSKNIRSLNVTVLPAWWQRTWVQVLAGLLLIGLISWVVARFYSLRLRQRIAALERQRELEGIRRRIAQDIHDEAGAGLTKIGLTAQVAAHLPPSDGNALKQKLDAILVETRNVSARLAEVLFAVNPRYDHFEAVQAWLREWSHRFLEDAGMEAEYDFPKSKYDPVLSPEVKRNLLLICKEALNNAVKYSGSARVRIRFSLDEKGRRYTLEVQDFGRGFSPEAVGAFSNGIAGMKGRASQIGAAISVESVLEEGTVVLVSGLLSG